MIGAICFFALRAIGFVLQDVQSVISSLIAGYGLISSITQAVSLLNIVYVAGILLLIAGVCLSKRAFGTVGSAMCLSYYFSSFITASYMLELASYVSYYYLKVLVPGVLFCIYWALLICAINLSKHQNILGIVAAFIYFGIALYMISSDFYTLSGYLVINWIACIGGAVALGFYYSSISNVQPKEFYLDDVAPSSNSSDSSCDVTFDTAVERLEKLKALMDDGVITQEEFDAKKKELLQL
jgi:hypothetical protein